MGFINAIDKTVAAFAPRKAIHRHLDRVMLEKISNAKKPKKRSYAAAKTSRLTGSWSPSDINVNDLIRASNPKVRARIRQLVRDFPIFTRAVTVSLDHIIGDGLKLQSLAVTASGKPDEKAIKTIESAWNTYIGEFDVMGKIDAYEGMRLGKRQEIENGEYLWIKRQIKDKKRFLPLAFQPVESDWLTDNVSDPVAKTNGIDQGIEYDKFTGAPLYYHFTNPESYGRSFKVPASEIIHGFETLRPGQMHGVSPFVSGVLVARDLGEYSDAEVDSAKMAAKYLAFVRKDPAAREFMLEDGEDEDEGKKIDEMENAIIEYLGEGEDITIASNPRPGNNFPPTVRFMVCMLSAATGVPYELLIFDYSGINYASTRVIRNDFAHQLKPVRRRHIRGMCNPIAEAFLDSAVLNGRIKLPGYFNNPERYQRFGWTLPGNELIDWLKESKAGISEMGVGIRSPQELVSSRGRDFDDVVTETQLAIKKLKDAELDFLIPLIWKDNSLASANNPAAIEDQGKNGNGSKSLSPQEAAAMNSRILSIMDDLGDRIDDIPIN